MGTKTLAGQRHTVAWPGGSQGWCARGPGIETRGSHHIIAHPIPRQIGFSGSGVRVNNRCIVTEQMKVNSHRIGNSELTKHAYSSYKSRYSVDTNSCFFTILLFSLPLFQQLIIVVCMYYVHISVQSRQQCLKNQNVTQVHDKNDSKQVQHSH